MEQPIRKQAREQKYMDTVYFRHQENHINQKQNKNGAEYLENHNYGIKKSTELKPDCAKENDGLPAI